MGWQTRKVSVAMELLNDVTKSFSLIASILFQRPDLISQITYATIQIPLNPPVEYFAGICTIFLQCK